MCQSVGQAANGEWANGGPKRGENNWAFGQVWASQSIGAKVGASEATSISYLLDFCSLVRQVCFLICKG